MRNISPLLLCVAGALLLQAGCGQKGALYRPDERAPQVPAQEETPASGKKKSLPAFPAPQVQKEDRARQQPPSDDSAPPEVDPSSPAPLPPPGT